MRSIDLMIALVLLVQLANGELSTSDGAIDADQIQDPTTWGNEPNVDEAHAAKEEVDVEELAEESKEETVNEQKLSSKERREIEDEEHNTEEMAQPDAAVDSAEEIIPEIKDSDSYYDEDESFAEYLDRKRRLEAQITIPGLTDVELIAFNAEYANAEILDKIIDWSYDQVAASSRFQDNYIHVEDLYAFLLKTLNPLDEEIDQQDEQILTDAVTELRRQQGLVDDEQVVYRGFIARGMPLRFLQSLAHDMHQTVQTRRLQALDEL